MNPNDTKVFIEDLLLKFQTGEENQLPNGTEIRFEIGDNRYTCKASQCGLEVYKTNGNGADFITISAPSSNRFIIK